MGKASGLTTVPIILSASHFPSAGLLSGCAQFPRMRGKDGGGGGRERLTAEGCGLWTVTYDERTRMLGR